MTASTIANATFIRAVRGELTEGQFLWCTSFAADPSKPGAPWKGAPVFPGKPLSLDPANNNYFSVAVLREVDGKRGRTAASFARLAALVADDPDRAALKRSPSWVLRTSADKVQIGFIIRADDPDASDPLKVTAALKAMQSIGVLAADQNGNNPVRYVRLPVGSNTKAAHGDPFEHELVEWQPDVVLTLREALAAFGADARCLDVLRDATDPLVPRKPTGADGDTLRLHLATVRKSAKEERGDWLRVGMALHHETDGSDEGCELWREWSATSHKYDDADLTRVWESFGKGTDRALVTLKTLRDMHDPSDPACEAARHALTMPEFDDVTAQAEAATAAAQAASVAAHPWARFIDLTGPLAATPFVIPGFIQEGTVLVSGAPGAGKTTAIVPLALIAAGLHREGEPLAPKHWRHVVYITEDEKQVQRILRALAGCPEWRAGLDTIKDRLHVSSAQRLKPAEAVRVGRVFREQFTRTVNGAEVLPLVVIDTTAAALALENENDNSEVSAAVAAFKQGFAGLPTWLVGHTAKASWGQADTAAMSTRGGGAWGADAHQQLFMIVEGGRRYLRLGKTRFEARWPELEIGSRAVVLPVMDPFGELDSEMVRWGEPSPGNLVKGAADRSDDDTRALLRLLADAEAAGNPIPTAEAGAHTASCILRGQAGYPSHRKPAEILHLLRAAETAGLLSRASHRGADRHLRGRWSVTESGHGLVNGV